MGTRSNTIIFDRNNQAILKMYRQMDGYPSGHGEELASFLSGITLINGLALEEDEKIGVKANGMNCLAAQIVSHFKTRIGSIYLENIKSSYRNIDYVYLVFENQLVVAKPSDDCAYKNVLFAGTPQNFLKELNYIENSEDDIESPNIVWNPPEGFEI